MSPIRFPYRNELLLPVIGLEAEVKPFVDGEEVEPEAVWRTPTAFIERPLPRSDPKVAPTEAPARSDLPSHQLVPSELGREQGASSSPSGPAQETLFR